MILEAGNTALSKVLISGGGRCNLMHDPTKQLSHILEVNLSTAFNVLR